MITLLLYLPSFTPFPPGKALPLLTLPAVRSYYRLYTIVQGRRDWAKLLEIKAYQQAASGIVPFTCLLLRSVNLFIWGEKTNQGFSIRAYSYFRGEKSAKYMLVPTHSLAHTHTQNFSLFCAATIMTAFSWNFPQCFFQLKAFKEEFDSCSMKTGKKLLSLDIHRISRSYFIHS